MVDEKDYAPEDSNVQSKSDLQGSSSRKAPQSTSTPKSEKGGEPSAKFTFLNRSPLDGYIVIVDVTMGRAEKIRIVYQNSVIGEFVGGDSYSETIMGGKSEAPPAEEMARIAAVARVDGEWKTIEESPVIA